MKFTNIDAYFDHKESYLDGFIDSGSDQELFVSSYIHGHFSVQAAKACALQSATDKERVHVFEQGLGDAVNLAIQNKELSSQDATDVKKMLGKLWQF